MNLNLSFLKLNYLIEFLFVLVLGVFFTANKNYSIYQNNVSETLNFSEKIINLTKVNLKILSFNFFYLHIFLGLVCLEIIYEYVSFMGNLATSLSATTPTTDQFLNIIPKLDTSFIHLGVYDFVKDLTFIFLVFFVRYVPFLLFSSVLLSFLRSTFVIMTNMGSPAGQPLIDSAYTFGGDLFFSGHTAIPFLWALVFWDNKYLRHFFFVCSFVFGAAALLGRFHYSIDVFSAPFFAYGVYKISEKIFPKYYNYTKKDFIV
jgi:hypothetical protein